MRDSDIGLTMNTYTDPRLLDVAGALNALPELPLDDSDKAERQKATGTDDRTLVPMLVQNAGKRCTTRTIPDKRDKNADPTERVVSVCTDKSCLNKTKGGVKRAIGLEPTTFSWEG